MTYGSRPALLLVACVLACGNGIGVTDASGVTSSDSSPNTTGPAPTTGGTDVAPTTGDPATAGTVGPTGSSGPATDGLPGSSTGDPPTTGGTGSSGSTGATDTGTGDTDAPVGCVNVDADYGDCEAEIGVGFDGTTCRSFSGCDCAPNCDHFFTDVVACASTCAAAGECNEAVINGAGLARGPVEQGDSCDEVDACAAPNSALAEWLGQLFPGLICEPGFPCQDQQSCHLQFQGTIGAEQWTDLCAASLLPDAALFCVIFGP